MTEFSAGVDIRDIKLREVLGWPVYKTVEDYINKKPLTKDDLMLPGMEVLTWFPGAWIIATLGKNEYREWFAETGNYYYPIRYDKKEGCYMFSGIINKKCFEKLRQISRVGGALVKT